MEAAIREQKEELIFELIFAASLATVRVVGGIKLRAFLHALPARTEIKVTRAAVALGRAAGEAIFHAGEAGLTLNVNIKPIASGADLNAGGCGLNGTVKEVFPRSTGAAICCAGCAG